MTRRRAALAGWALTAMACGREPAPTPVAERLGELAHPGAPHAAQIAGPALAVGPDGAPQLAWIRSADSDRSVQRAVLAEGDFQTVRVDRDGTAPSSAHQGPGLAVGPDGRAHLTWSARRADPGGSHFASDLWLASERADGSFAAQRLSEDAPGSRGFETLAVTRGGALVAAWIESGRSSLARALRIAPDGTRTEALLDEQTCPCCRFAAASQGERTGLLWRDEREGRLRDMLFAELTAEGAGPVRTVREDGWALDACPHRGGALAFAPDGSALAAWYTEGGDARPRLLLAWGGATGFAPPIEVHGEPGSLPDRVALAVDTAGRALVLYERRTPVRSEIAARALAGQGAPLGPPRVLSRGLHAAHPQLVAAPGGGFVASWNEESFPTLHSVVAHIELETASE